MKFVLLVACSVLLSGCGAIGGLIGAVVTIPAKVIGAATLDETSESNQLDIDELRNQEAAPLNQQ